MIRATASAATPRATVRDAPARRPVLLTLLLMTVLAVGGTGLVGQRAAAAELQQDDVWVSVDGVAFQRSWESDQMSYVVRPVGSRNDGRAFTRDLSRDERNSGWAAFWEARRSYPDGYCVVWVEVEDAGSWHESENSTACTASEPVEAPPPTPAPEPEPTVTQGPEPTQEPTPEPEPEQPEAAEPTPTPTPTSVPTETASTPTPSPSPTPTPSPTPSPSASATPSPSPSSTPPQAGLLRGFQEQPPVRTQVGVAEQEEIISPLGWVAVLGSGAVLAAGGVLMLWRRLT